MWVVEEVEVEVDVIVVAIVVACTLIKVIVAETPLKRTPAPSVMKVMYI